jgi:hypothetical protein
VVSCLVLQRQLKPQQPTNPVNRCQLQALRTTLLTTANTRDAHNHNIDAMPWQACRPHSCSKQLTQLPSCQSIATQAAAPAMHTHVRDIDALLQALPCSAAFLHACNSPHTMLYTHNMMHRATSHLQRQLPSTTTLIILPNQGIRLPDELWHAAIASLSRLHHDVYVMTVGLSLPVNSCSFDRSRATCRQQTHQQHAHIVRLCNMVKHMLIVLVGTPAGIDRSRGDATPAAAAAAAAATRRSRCQPLTAVHVLETALAGSAAYLSYLQPHRLVPDI